MVVDHSPRPDRDDAETRWSLDQLSEHIRCGLARPSEPPRRVVLAFSGGADSTALLLGLLRLPRQLRPSIVAIHVDHGWDERSAERAIQARNLAMEIGAKANVPVAAEIVAVPQPETTGTLARERPTEAQARIARYRVLEIARQRHAADVILTAHHASDQLETLVLRLRQGTGLLGLAGIQSRRHRVLRPLLSPNPGETPDRHDLVRIVAASGFEPVDDPSNRDLRIQRNFVRHQLIPRLVHARRPHPASTPVQETAAQKLNELAQRVAVSALAARAVLDRRLTQQLRLERTAKNTKFDLASWLSLPASLQDVSLDTLHRAAGAGLPAGSAAKSELRRQLRIRLEPASSPDWEETGTPASRLDDQPGGQAGDHPGVQTNALASNKANVQPKAVAARCTNRVDSTISWLRQSARDRQLRPPSLDCSGGPVAAVACDCGDGWRWKTVRTSDVEPYSWALALNRSDAAPHPTLRSFTYNLSIPGVTRIPDLGVQIEASVASPRPWMRKAWPHRVALVVPRQDAVVTVRTRKPGDRIVPFGARSQRIKLKKLLIDRKVPRTQRDRLPIVCVDGEIAWVAGVALANPFRLPDRNLGPNQTLLQLRLSHLEPNLRQRIKATRKSKPNARFSASLAS